MGHGLATLRGSIAAIATPFQETRLDIPGLTRLCERQIARGTRAIVVCGSTGEASSLNPEEYLAAVGAAVRTAAGRVPVIAGCTAPATSVAVAIAEMAAGAGVDALLCAAPPYVKPTQDGILAHIRAIAHSCEVPIVLYDVPSRSGVGIADATVAALFKRGLIFALKDATADLSRPPRLRALCGPDLVQLSGDDATAAAYRAMGGAGCISVTANVAPQLCAALHHAWESHDRGMFEHLRDLLDPLHAALFTETNPIPLKAALEMLDLCGGGVRLPLTRAQFQTVERVREAMAPVMDEEERLAAPRRYALVG